MHYLKTIRLILLFSCTAAFGQTIVKPSSSITPCLGEYTKAWFNTSYSYDSVQWVNSLGEIVSKQDTLLITPALTPNASLYIFDLKLYVGGIVYPSKLYVVPFTGFDFSINNDTQICEGDTLVIKVNNPKNEDLSYKWYSSIAGFINLPTTTTEIKRAKPGKYWVKANNKNMTCTLVDTMLLETINQPIELGEDKEICEGKSVVLENKNTELPNTSHVWSYGSNTSVTTTLTATETYTYILTNTLSPSNCSFTDSVNVIVNPVPKIDLTPNETICRGKEIIIKNQLQNDSSLIYTTQWTSTASLPPIAPKQETISVSKQGVYTLTLTTGKCEASDSTQIDLLKFDVDLGKNIPDTCTNSAITLFNLKANTEPTTTYYLWQTPEGNFKSKNISAKKRGYYSLLVTSDNPICAIKDSVFLGFSSAPTFDLGDDIVEEKSFSVFDGTFSNRFTESDYNFTWKELNSDSIYSTKANLILEQHGTHTLTLIIENKTTKCVSSDFFTITIPEEPIIASHVIFIPSAFSPSMADSENSKMKVLGPDISNEEFKLEVFNRWGEVLFETTDYQFMSKTGWSGEVNSTNLQSGTYTYSTRGQFIDGVPFKKTGSITLLR